MANMCHILFLFSAETLGQAGNLHRRNESLAMNRNVKYWIYHLCYECEIGFVVYWLLRNVKRILKISFFVVKTMRFSCCTGINFVCTPRKPTLCFTIISRRTATHISPGLWVNTRVGSKSAISTQHTYGRKEPRKWNERVIAYWLITLFLYSVNEFEMLL